MPTDQNSWPSRPAESNGGYAALPVGFFVGQWAGGLTGRAIGSLLILIDRANPRISMPKADYGPPTYVAESVLKGTYGVSEDFFRQGRQELAKVGLVSCGLNKRWAREEGGWGGVESTLVVKKLREEAHPRFAGEDGRDIFPP